MSVVDPVDHDRRRALRKPSRQPVQERLQRHLGDILLGWAGVASVVLVAVLRTLDGAAETLTIVAIAVVPPVLVASVAEVRTRATFHRRGARRKMRG